MTREQAELVRRLEAMFAGEQPSETRLMAAILAEVEERLQALDAFQRRVARTFHHPDVLAQRLQSWQAEPGS